MKRPRIPLFVEFPGALHEDEGPLPPLLPRGLVLQPAAPEGGLPQVHRLDPGPA